MKTLFNSRETKLQDHLCFRCLDEFLGIGATSGFCIIDCDLKLGGCEEVL